MILRDNKGGRQIVGKPEDGIICSYLGCDILILTNQGHKKLLGQRKHIIYYVGVCEAEYHARQYE